MKRVFCLNICFIATIAFAADPVPLSTSEFEALGDNVAGTAGPPEIPEMEITVDLPIEIRDSTSASMLMQATQKIIEATQIEIPPGARGIQLYEVVQETLNRNYSLQSARTNPLTAETRVDVERSAFDPVAFANVVFRRSKSPQREFNFLTGEFSGELEATVTRDRGLFDRNLSDQGFGIRQRFFTGTRVQAEVSGARQIRTTGSNPFGSLTDGYATVAAIDIVQPLLRGYGVKSNLAFLRIAYNGKLISEEQLRLVTLGLIAQAHTAYWNLVFARVNLAISQQSLTLAADLLRENRIRYKYGDLIAVEVYEAQAGVKAREQDVIVAENTLYNGMDDLRELMAFDRNEPGWQAPLVPLDAPSFQSVEIEEEVSLQIALEKNPEIRLIEIRKRNSRENQIVARDNYRPRLDLFAAFSERGLGSNLDRSIDVLDDSKFTSYEIGAQFESPIYRRGERADMRAADLSHRKSKIDLKDVKQQVTYSHREAVRNIEDLMRAIAAAKASVVAERNRLENSRIGHEQGVTTSNDLLEAQEDFARAQVDEIDRIVKYYISLIQLERIRGTLLDSLGFEFVDMRNEAR